MTKADAGVLQKHLASKLQIDIFKVLQEVEITWNDKPWTTLLAGCPEFRNPDLRAKLQSMSPITEAIISNKKHALTSPEVLEKKLEEFCSAGGSGKFTING